MEWQSVSTVSKLLLQHSVIAALDLFLIAVHAWAVAAQCPCSLQCNAQEIGTLHLFVNVHGWCTSVQLSPSGSLPVFSFQLWWRVIPSFPIPQDIAGAPTQKNAILQPFIILVFDTKYMYKQYQKYFIQIISFQTICLSLGVFPISIPNNTSALPIISKKSFSLW